MGHGIAQAAFDEIFATRPWDEWLDVFGKYDLFCCGVNTQKELANDPQIVENGYLIDFEHPTLRRVSIQGYPGHFSESWARTTSATPEL